MSFDPKTIIRKGTSAGASIEHPPKVASVPTAIEALDLQVLLDKAGLILTREIQNLLSESAKGKLQKQSATDLIALVKLLKEMRKEELEELESMNDDELKAAVQTED